MRTEITAAFAALCCAVAASPAGAQAERPRTTIVSRGGNDESLGCDVSTGGRAVAFFSSASNFVRRDTNDRHDVFLATGDGIDRVSVTSREKQSLTYAIDPSVSDDGTQVAFLAGAYQLKNAEGRRRHVFVRDTAAGETARVNVSRDGGRPDAGSGAPDISGNGRHVAFHSVATNLTGHSDDNGVADVYVRRLARGETLRASFGAYGDDPDSVSFDPAVSGTGTFVAFTSFASNVVRDDRNETSDVFRFDRKTGRTTRLSIASDGNEGDMPSSGPAISADGRFVAFQSESALVPHDSNGTFDVYVHDVRTGTTELVSAAPVPAAGNGRSWQPSISDDGRYVAFTSTASDLAPGDSDGTNPVDEGWDVFVRDRMRQETTMVGVGDEGQNGDRDSHGARISPDGSFVCWTSESTNLVPDDDNGKADVFLRGPLDLGQE